MLVEDECCDDLVEMAHELSAVADLAAGDEQLATQA